MGVNALLIEQACGCKRDEERTAHARKHHVVDVTLGDGLPRFTQEFHAFGGGIEVDDVANGSRLFQYFGKKLIG